MKVKFLGTNSNLGPIFYEPTPWHGLFLKSTYNGIWNLEHLLEQCHFLLVPSGRVDNNHFEAVIFEFVHPIRCDDHRVHLSVTRIMPGNSWKNIIIFLVVVPLENYAEKATANETLEFITIFNRFSAKLGILACIFGIRGQLHHFFFI